MNSNLVILSVSRARFVWLLIIGIILASCGGDSRDFIEAIEAGKLNIKGIRIETVNPTINADWDSQFTAYGIPVDDEATELVISDLVNWRVTDDSLASINGFGLLSAKADGVVNVIAEFSRFSTQFEQTINTASLESIEIQGIIDIDECQNHRLGAEGRYDDGTTRQIPGQEIVTWTISPEVPDVAVINQTSGLLKTWLAGTITIVAESSGVTGSADVVVKNTLTSISINPVNPAVPKNSTIQLSATGGYTSGDQDITNNATWQSASTNIATIDDDTSKGEVTGVTVDTTTITAECGGETVTASLQVTPEAVLTSIKINDGDAEVSVDEPVTGSFVEEKLTLTAFFTDSNGVITEKDVTRDATWNVTSLNGTDLSVASDDDDEDNKGTVTINPGKGTAVIKADYKSEEDTISIKVK